MNDTREMENRGEPATNDKTHYVQIDSNVKKQSISQWREKMNKILRICVPVIILLVALGAFTLRWDMQYATAATALTWNLAAPLIDPVISIMVKCMDDPNHFYLVGGAYTGRVSEGFYRYTIGFPGEWEQWPDLPDGLEGVLAACYEGKIYVAGGTNAGVVVTKGLYIYDLADGPDGQWATGVRLPDVITYGSMGAWDGKLYVIGGIRSHQNLVPVSRVDVYDIASAQWTPGGGADMPFTASHFGFGAQAGPYFYVVGGIGDPYPTHVDQTQRYNMETDTWDLGPEFTSARIFISASITNSHLYALGGDLPGGSDFDAVDLVETLDLSTWITGTWEDLEDPLPQAALDPASTCSNVLTGGEIWQLEALTPISLCSISIYTAPPSPA
jgi:hypothetical protein